MIKVVTEAAKQLAKNPKVRKTTGSIITSIGASYGKDLLNAGARHLAKAGPRLKQGARNAMAADAQRTMQEGQDAIDLYNRLMGRGK